MPRAVVPFCGILQVSDPRRFERMGLSSRVTQPVIDSCFANYLVGDSTIDVTAVHRSPEQAGLADPLCVIEQTPPARPYPPFYIPCGTADPLIDDSRRLAEALRAHGGMAQASEFDGMGHSFHAWIVRKEARLCWSETHAFLDSALGIHPSDAPPADTAESPE